MADFRKRKHGGEPVLEFFWDSLELAADNTYSTTIRIRVSGWWEGGRPRSLAVSVHQRGEEPPAGYQVAVQNNSAIYPLTGLLPGHHYLVVVFTADYRRQVEKLIPVPEIPKPKKSTSDEKKTVALKARLERVKAEQELEEAERKLARGLKKTRFPEPILRPEVQITIVESVKEEKKPEKVSRPSLFQRVQEAYTQERNKRKAPAFEFKISKFNADIL